MVRKIQEYGTSDVYNKFSNFFELTVKKGKLFEVPNNKVEEIDKGLIIKDLKNNIYLTHTKITGKEKETSFDDTLLRRLITKRFCNKLEEEHYKKRSKYVYYNPKDKINHTNIDIFEIYEGFEFRILSIDSSLALVIDPHLILRFVINLKDLLKNGVKKEFFEGQPVNYLGSEDIRLDGYIEKIDSEDTADIYDTHQKTTVQANNDVIYLEPRPEIIQGVIDLLGRTGDIIKLQRQLSFLDSPVASKDRFSKTIEILKRLDKNKIFPLKFGDFEVSLSRIAIPLRL